MRNIEKLRLFKAGTSKADLTANNVIMNLEEYALESSAKYNLDSSHMHRIILDVDLLGDKVNNIPQHGVIESYAQNQYDYWIIINIDKNLDTVELTCRHWTTEILRSMYLVDSKPRDLSAYNMLDWFKTSTEEYKQGKQFARDLEVSSNLSDSKSMNAWHDNFYNVLSDMQELWGCEIKKSGFKVELVDYVGSKIAKYKIEYGKNLISNESEEDLSVITGVLAKGYDKLYADNIIYSGKLKDNIDMLGETIEKEYPIRVREEGKEDEEGYTYYNTESEAKAELERLAGLEFTENHIDEPLLTFDTEFLELSTVEEHKNDAKVWLSIGDKVAIYIPKFNIDIETRIVEMEVDILADEITNITLSNNDIKDLKPPTLNSIKQEIQKLPNIEDVILTAKKESINTVMNGFGGYSHYAKNFTAWTDNEDIKQARKGIVANKHGIMFFKNGIDIESGEANDVTLIMDVNGNFNCSVLNSGEINAALIKTGLITSVNGRMVIDVNSGIISNGANGYSTTMDRGGHIFQSEGENVGAIRSSSFSSNRNINGLSVVAMAQGDYLDIGYTDSSEIDENSTFIPIIRYAKTKHELLGNFIGIQLKEHLKLDHGKSIYIDNGTEHPHCIFNTTEKHLAMYGNNGVSLGYMDGTEYIRGLHIVETPDQYGNQVFINKQTSLNGNNLRQVNDIYTQNTKRYFHEGWCGKTEIEATRISNLNYYLDSGWYSFGSDAVGRPCDWGVLLHFKCFGSDFAQIAFGTNNVMYTRWWVNNGWTSWRTI